PVALPSSVGFVLASSPLRSYKIEALSFISTSDGQDSLIVPLLSAILLSSALYFSPPELGNKRDLVSGAIVGLLVGVVPQAIFFPWMIIVVLFWISQSLYVWRHDFPPFRIGLWIGLGGSSGLFLGGFLAHYFL
ncbi:MAG TPA: hypothetical protein QF703_02880, partial [Candidatus Thalassarchaeaceae archaeon]|nr:hypothetical protein [Candidatus Thalassarchaeaceae archaeon]